MTQNGWSMGKIALVLYPFGAGAMAVNVFFASLIGSWIGWPVLSTQWSIVCGCVIGVPVTLSMIYLLVARWAGLTVSGVGMPTHFLVRLHGVRPVLVDPYYGGRDGFTEMIAMLEAAMDGLVARVRADLERNRGTA